MEEKKTDCKEDQESPTRDFCHLVGGSEEGDVHTETARFFFVSYFVLFYFPFSVTFEQSQF